MNALKVSVTTPYGMIFDGEADYVALPGAEGEFGVMSGHSDMLALLKTGVIELNHNKSKELVAINWGYAKVQGNQVDILIDRAVLIDKNSSQMSKAMENAKKLLEEASSDKIAFSSVVSKIDSITKG